jgi:class 3 adenylate cyclase
VSLLADPETRYARLGDERIAYQVIGDGPPDLVLSSGTFGSIDLDFQDPMVARMYRRIGQFCRLVRFDRRGSGASDPRPPDSSAAWGSATEEFVAVMDAIGSRRAVVMGMFDAGPVAALLAATHRDRVDGLILANTAARLLRDDDYEIGVLPEHAAGIVDQVVRTWGSEDQVAQQVPSRASDDTFRRWFARYTRSIAGPGSVRARLATMLQADARDALRHVDVPTLVLHRSAYALFRIEHGRYLADSIRGASFVELPGRDGPLAWEHPDLAVEAIEEFLTGTRGAREPERALLTILFTDIVGSTARATQIGDRRWRSLLDRHDDTARRVVAAAGGRVVETTGDGVLATFDGPGQAVRAASVLRAELDRLELAIRAGVHTGEVERRGEGIGGLAVHIGARVMQAAGDGEILVSRTVRDLLLGSGVRLVDRGPHDLKGVPGTWELFSVAD